MSLAPALENKPARAVLRTTGFFGVTLATFLAASSAPTPLYRIYQERFATSPVLITIVFAVYAIALLTALLFAGSLSDHLGRKPVIVGALALEMIAMALFLAAHGPDGLIAARAVQGVATGIAAASLGAALVDVDVATGQLVNAFAPFAGMTTGVLGSSLLVQLAPLPMQLGYALLLVVFLLQTAMLWLLVPETGSVRQGSAAAALASLRPRVAVPPRARRPLALITPINVANWTLGGFYLSLVPSLVVSVTGSRAPLTGGAVVGALMLAGTLTILVRRTRDATANLAFGVPMATAGIAVVVAGVHLASVPLLVVGALLTGMGFGTNYLGCIGAIVPLARADQRAGLLSVFYIQSYLAFSVPAIIAGVLVKLVGYATTADIFGSLVAVSGLTGLALLLRDRRKSPSFRAERSEDPEPVCLDAGR